MMLKSLRKVDDEWGMVCFYIGCVLIYEYLGEFLRDG